MAAPGRCLYEEMLQVSLSKHITWFNFVKCKTEIIFNDLTELNLSRIIIFEDRLKLIVERNTKINHIALGFLNLKNGSSLLKLNPNIIEVFVLKHFIVDSGETMTTFLSRLKNLRLLEISILNIHKHEIVDTLNKNVRNVYKKEVVLNDDSINELKFFRFANHHAFNIIIQKELLINKKPFTRIRLYSLPNELIDSIIGWSNISSIHLQYLTEKLFNALDKFVNLTLLRGSMRNFTDDEIQNISKCSKLKDLILKMETFDITDHGVYFFGKLCWLECLRMEVALKEGSCHDKSLLAFSQCNQLNKITLVGFQFNEIEKYDPFSNLEMFEIHFSNINNSSLEEIISKSPILKYCKVKECKQVTKKCVELLNDKRKYPGLFAEFEVEKNGCFCIIL